MAMNIVQTGREFRIFFLYTPYMALSNQKAVY